MDNGRVGSVGVIDRKTLNSYIYSIRRHKYVEVLVNVTRILERPMGADFHNRHLSGVLVYAV